MYAAPRTPDRFDLGIATLLTVLAAVELNLNYAFERTTEPGPVAAHYLVAVTLGVVLACRRVFPLLVAPSVQIVLAVQATVLAMPNTYVSIVMLVVAIYSLAVYAPTPRSTIPPTVLVLVAGYWLGLQDPDDPLGSAITSVLATGLVLFVGFVVRRQRAHAEAANRERDEAKAHAHRVAAEERARIARELHDVVAHGMSVVVLQARGGLRLIDTEPASTREALTEIDRVASECLEEMRRLLEILRTTDGDGAPLTPQPSTRLLPLLVERVRASGASIDLEIVGQPRELPPAIELSVYRIAQEAVTNALKHAGGSRTRILLSYGEAAVSVEVSDDGPAEMAPDHGRGHGLIGMRERVELFGGTFCAGPESDGGFAVRARLPLRSGV